MCLLPSSGLSRGWEKVPDRADEGPLPPLNAACVAIVQRRTDMHVCHPGQRENLLGLGFKLSRSHHLARAIDDAVTRHAAKTPRATFPTCCAGGEG